MDAVIELIAEHGAYGIFISFVIIVGYIFYRLWRDLVDDRNYWRDKTLRLISVGETLATKSSPLVVDEESDEVDDHAPEK